MLAIYRYYAQGLTNTPAKPQRSRLRPEELASFLVPTDRGPSGSARSGLIRHRPWPNWPIVVGILWIRGNGSTSGSHPRHLEAISAWPDRMADRVWT